MIRSGRAWPAKAAQRAPASRNGASCADDIWPGRNAEPSRVAVKASGTSAVLDCGAIASPVYSATLFFGTRMYLRQMEEEHDGYAQPERCDEEWSGIAAGLVREGSDP